MPTTTHTYFRPQAKRTRQRSVDRSTAGAAVHSNLLPHITARTPPCTPLCTWDTGARHLATLTVIANATLANITQLTHNTTARQSWPSPPRLSDSSGRTPGCLCSKAARPKDAHPVKSSSCTQPTACATEHALHVQLTTALHAQATNALHAQQRHSLNLPTHPATQQPAASHIQTGLQISTGRLCAAPQCCSTCNTAP